jgi:CTP synthase (UTP-ammonia lyase)
MAETSPTSQIALIGDHDPQVTAHRAIPLALKIAAANLHVPIRFDWIHTSTLGATPDEMLKSYQGIWCVPASPYANPAGAIAAIRYARRQNRPFLGTCAGFQHALLEFAQDVLGIANPKHAETDPKAIDPLITPLACSLVEATAKIRLLPGSRLARAYERTEIVEGYHCRFGLSRAFYEKFANSALRPVGWDAQGEIRAVELVEHPFFVATLFQPERAALLNLSPPPVRAFVQAVLLVAR